ncbi:MAG: methylated-DNA--[protein]-cysteine S-methyltransferase [Thiomicrospira sp.]|uniref:methylated-DNA--[protein]-cysteine S-methyltransferase n=1 Tax=Thiomicrospira sp. TaxID=935 RepID=UPI0019EA9A8B|nr:methylated-DNA--[protein]-cysteine S-methyltransferase [Thiomicrospira sp.]MBE0494192.1 methylated-DNA--[protein]-cysteine S-methyltransferase [Thiomicrospira sp.]
MTESTLLTYGQHRTRFGEVYLLLDQQGLRRCDFRPFPLAAVQYQTDSTLTQPVAEAIGEAEYSITLCPQGTPFQQTVWQAITQIPFGQTTDYLSLAQQIGRPTASRAVANAVGANPISWYIACHRVIRRNGELGGYAWGSELKQNLLDWEQHGRTR